MPYPDNFNARRYNEVWDASGDERAEAMTLLSALKSHVEPLHDVLIGVEFHDTILRDMCYNLAKHLENEVANIRKKGNF